MTGLGLTPDDYRHSALVDEISTAIETVLAEHDWTVHGAVLAALLARFVIAFPPALRAGITAEHVKLAHGLVELLELQAENRQAN